MPLNPPESPEGIESAPPDVFTEVKKVLLNAPLVLAASTGINETSSTVTDCGTGISSLAVSSVLGRLAAGSEPFGIEAAAGSAVISSLGGAEASSCSATDGTAGSAIVTDRGVQDQPNCLDRSRIKGRVKAYTLIWWARQLRHAFVCGQLPHRQVVQQVH